MPISNSYPQRFPDASKNVRQQLGKSDCFLEQALRLFETGNVSPTNEIKKITNYKLVNYLSLKSKYLDVISRVSAV